MNPKPYGQDMSRDTSIDDAIILASVRDSVNDKLKRRSNDIISQLNGELNTLRRTESELKAGKHKIEEMHHAINQEKEKCKSSITSYTNQIEEMNQEIGNLENGNQIDPENIITPSTPIYKQIFHSHAQEQVNLKTSNIFRLTDFCFIRLSKMQFILSAKHSAVAQLIAKHFYDMFGGYLVSR